MYIHVYYSQCRQVYRRTTMCAPSRGEGRVYKDQTLVYVSVVKLKRYVCLCACVYGCASPLVYVCMCVAVMQGQKEMASPPGASLLPGVLPRAGPCQAWFGCAADQGGPGVRMLRGVRGAPAMSTLYIW